MSEKVLANVTPAWGLPDSKIENLYWLSCLMTLPPQQQALVYDHYELCTIRSAIERVYNRQARGRIGQKLVVNIGGP